MYKLLSFDVYGTLINTTPINVKAFLNLRFSPSTPISTCATARAMAPPAPSSPGKASMTVALGTSRIDLRNSRLARGHDDGLKRPANGRSDAAGSDHDIRSGEREIGRVSRHR